MLARQEVKFGTHDSKCVDSTLQFGVVLVDPSSTGANLALRLMEDGISIIRVWSQACTEDLKSLVVGDVLEFIDTFEEMPQNDEQADSASTLVCLVTESAQRHGCYVGAVLAGSETAVLLTDTLAARLGVRGGNDPTTSLYRRDKYIMHQALRQAGVPIMEQAVVDNEEDIKTFMQNLGSDDVVVKPRMSAGTDGVVLCQSLEEVLSAARSMLGCNNAIGVRNDTLLVQERLRGREYVVDSVSRDGVVKVMAVWVYDKRPANGGAFVYFGMDYVRPSDPVYNALIQYHKDVLTAVGIQQGPAHAEIIVTDRGPILVEIAARPHGSEGGFDRIAKECVGYSLLDGIVASILRDPSTFDAFPHVPQTTRKAGRLMDLVSYSSGRLQRIGSEAEIRALPSFLGFHMMPKLGSLITPTVDCWTAVGMIQLAHSDPQVLAGDCEFLETLQQENRFFIFD